MKLLIISFTMSVSSLSSPLYSQTRPDKEFNLKGKIIGQDTGYVHIRYLNSEAKFIDDSCHLENGNFTFNGFISEPTSVFFYGNRKSRNIDDPNFTELFLEPAFMEAIFRVNNFKQGEIMGSKTEAEYKIYQKRQDSLYSKWQSIFDELKTARENNDSGKIETFDKKISIYRKLSNNVGYSFIREFPNSYISANILLSKTQILLPDTLKKLYYSLSNTVRNSYDGKSIQDFIQKAEKLEVGMQAPEFIQKDLNGKDVSLRDFRGKYVLLDFWASWCIPCREENPYLKQAYLKYHDKGFTIIGFSLDRLNEKNAWLNAIQNDGLPWIQVCDFKGLNGEVINEYNLVGKGIPANFLISPDGKIIAKDIRGEKIEEKLNEFIK